MQHPTNALHTETIQTEQITPAQTPHNLRRNVSTAPKPISSTRTITPNFRIQHKRPQITPVTTTAVTTTAVTTTTPKAKPRNITIHTPARTATRAQTATRTPQSQTRRKLIFFASTPTAKRACQKTPPRFHISGNKERTQPTNKHTPQNTLTQTISNQHAIAQTACMSFRACIANTSYNATHVHTGALIIRVLSSAHQLFIGAPLTLDQSESVIVAVFATRDMLVDERRPDHAQQQDIVLFIPEPWYITMPESLTQADCIITPIKLSIIEMSRLPTPLTKLVNNDVSQTLKRLKSKQVATANHNANTSPDGMPYHTFAHICPHSLQVAITMEVNVCMHDEKLALVSDSADELALLQYHENSIPESGYHTLPKVYVLPDRISAQAVLNITPPTQNPTIASKLQTNEQKSLLVLTTNSPIK